MLWLSLLAAVPLAAPVPVTNAWPNPGAEVDLAGAAADAPDATDVGLTAQDGDAWRGKRCFELRFTPGPKGSGAVVFGTVPVTAGQTAFLRVAGRVAAGAPGTALELRARWLDATGKLLLETPQVCQVTPSARRPWVVLDGWDTAPDGAAAVALALYATGAAGATVLRADGVQLTLDPTRFPPYVTGDEPGCAWLGAPGASASRGPSACVNLVPNPSFEHGAGGWRAGTGAGGACRSLAVDRTWAAAGQASLHLAGTVAAQPNSYLSLLSQPIPVLGGQEYTLRAVVNVARLPAGGKVGLVLGWLDSTGAYQLAESFADQAVVAEGGVHELVVTKPAPRDAAAALAVVGSVGGVPGEYELRADAFSLVADSGAPPARPFWVGFNDMLMNGGPVSTEVDVARSVELGINCVRMPINLFMGDLYQRVWPSPDAPINLDPIAPTVDAFFKAGIRWLLLPPITPWMMKQGHLDPAHYANVGKLAAACLKRWPQIVAVEAHNEPNAANFWPPKADPKQFVAYLEAFTKEIRAVDPAMPILAPSCNCPQGNDKNYTQPAFLRAFYAAGGGRWCDALSIHPYPFGCSSGSGTAEALKIWEAWGDQSMRELREVRDANRDGAKPIWITELGSPTTKPVHPLELIVKPVTEEQQARSTVLLYDWARRQGDVRSCIYHTNVSKPPPPNGGEGDFGLFAPDGRLKPSFAALQAELHRTGVGYFDGDREGARWLGEAGMSASVTAAAAR